MKAIRLTAVLLLAFAAWGGSAAAQHQQDPMPQSIPPALDQAVQLVLSDLQLERQYDYVMTGQVRLLIFWIGRDDVGGGYIRLERADSRPELEAIRLKIGSDPDKAPRRINRWGAATEVIERDPLLGSARSTAFFGFMKATSGDSVDAVERELASEGTGSRHVFEASINSIDPVVAQSSVLPIVSPVDFDIGQLDDADRMVREQYERAFRMSRYRRLNGTSRASCARSESFLFTVKELVDAALAGQRAPASRCYVYNSKMMSLTLTDRDVVASRTISYEMADGREVSHEYSDVLELRFNVRNEETRWDADFELLVATDGVLRGAPVQITYQPNFWFKATLNLHEASGGGIAAGQGGAAAGSARE